MKSLSWPKVTSFDAFGQTYALPLKTQGPSHVPSEAEMWYLGGFFDGDGCVTYSSSFCRLSLSQLARNATVVLMFRRAFGGGICSEKNGQGVRQPVLQWYITGSAASVAAELLSAYCSGKAEQLRLAAQWPKTANDRAAASTQLHMLKRAAPNLMGCASITWPYIAGLFDSDGYVHVPTTQATIYLYIEQKYDAILHKTLDFLAAEMPGHTGMKVKAKGEAYVLSITTLGTSTHALRKLLQAGLLVKRQSATCVLDMSAEKHAEIREQLQVYTSGNQSRHRRLDFDGCQRARCISKLQKRLWYVRRTEKVGLVTQLEDALQVLQDQHRIKSTVAQNLLWEEDIRRLIAAGATSCLLSPLEDSE